MCFVSGMVFFDIILEGARHCFKCFYMSYLFILTTPWGRYYYPYIMGKKLKYRKVKKKLVSDTQVVGLTPETAISLFCFIILSS